MHGSIFDPRGALAVVGLYIFLLGACVGTVRGGPDGVAAAGATTVGPLGADGASSTSTSSAHTLFQFAEQIRFGSGGMPKDTKRARALYRKAVEMDGGGKHGAAALNALAEMVWEALPEASPSEVRETVKLYNESARNGNPYAHFMMGVFHSTGLFQTEVNQAKALLHFHFSAVGNDTRGMMAAGYRTYFGVGVPKNCKRAVVYYELAANVVVDLADAKGMTEPNEQKRVSDATLKVGSKQHGDEEVVRYYQFSADRKDLRGLVGLGQLYYYGLRGLDQDFGRAFDLFQEAAKHHASSGGNAFANLGHMYLHGFARPGPGEAAAGAGARTPDYAKALEMFEVAKKNGNSHGFAGLGVMYLWGMGVEQDVTEALKNLKKGAEAGNAIAHYNLGVLYLGAGVKGTEAHRNFRAAAQHFTVASQAGHLHSKHKLANMYLHGIGTDENCDNAAKLFKQVAEAGVHADAQRSAHQLVEAGKLLKALAKYATNAEMGYQVAQENAAWVYEEMLADHDAEFMGLLPSSATRDADGEKRSLREPFGLRMWEHASGQGNIFASLRVGDIYFYGRQGADVDYGRASVHYQKAASLGSAQAMFNLGFLHHFGHGTKDYHLAKRWYDTAMTKDRNAFYPCIFALHHLYVRSAWESSTDWKEFLSAMYSTLTARWVKGKQFELFLGSKPLHP